MASVDAAHPVDRHVLHEEVADDERLLLLGVGEIDRLGHPDPFRRAVPSVDTYGTQCNNRAARRIRQPIAAARSHFGNDARVRERKGRPPATTREVLEEVALELFVSNGFAETTVDEIADAAGISRRTLFRYYPSKNDLVWGDFDGLLRDLDTWLSGVPDEVPLMTALTDAIVRFNEVPPEAESAHRRRMSLILYVPALQANSALRYADWRAVVARFAGRRLGAEVDALAPQLVSHICLGAAVTAYEQWLRHDGVRLGTLIRAAFEAVEVHPPGR